MTDKDGTQDTFSLSIAELCRHETDVADKWIRGIPDATLCDWTSVATLPKEGRYLVTYRLYDSMNSPLGVTEAHYSFDSWIIDRDEVISRYVIAWAPLPEPYKEPECDSK